LHSIKVTVRAGSKTGFDHIDFKPLKLARNAQLFITRHRRTGRLFTIAQGGVKNNQFVGHVVCPEIW